jgi:ribulose-phosphate 3-epimerase
MAVIYPTLLAFDVLNPQREIERIEPLAEGFQLDIMDNHFVPNLMYGADFVNAVARITHKKQWVHLMVDDPVGWLGGLFVPPGSIMTFHIEATHHITGTIKYIVEKKWLPSIAINPETPVEAVFPFLPMLHQVSLMSVEPGFPRQEFLKETLEKFRKLRGYRQTSQLQFRIALDGGINKINIKNLVMEGVDDLAIASAIFGQKDPLKELRELIELKNQAEQEINQKRAL